MRLQSQQVPLSFQVTFEVKLTKLASFTKFEVTFEIQTYPNLSKLTNFNSNGREAYIRGGHSGDLVYIGDPTFGIPFSTALYGAQPELTKRLEALSSVVKGRVHRASLQMAAQAQAF